MPSMIFTPDNLTGVSYFFADNVTGSYPISSADFEANPNPALWTLDSTTQLPRLKTQAELGSTPSPFSVGSFLKALAQAFTPLELETLCGQFPSFVTFLGFQNWAAIKQIFDNKIQSGVITETTYEQVNAVFQQFGVNLDDYT
jgi:hypothetical protein